MLLLAAFVIVVPLPMLMELLVFSALLDITQLLEELVNSAQSINSHPMMELALALLADLVMKSTPQELDALLANLVSSLLMIPIVKLAL